MRKTIQGEKYRRLLEFLKDSFEPEDLEIFLTLNGFEEVVGEVDRTTAAARYCFCVVRR
jgi:hypothetical protein